MRDQAEYRKKKHPRRYTPKTLACRDRLWRKVAKAALNLEPAPYSKTLTVYDKHGPTYPDQSDECALTFCEDLKLYGYECWVAHSRWDTVDQMYFTDIEVWNPKLKN